MEIKTPITAILGNKGSETFSVGPDCTVLDAISLMSQKNIGALPVMKDGNLVGVISERDYTRKVVLMGRASRDTAVTQIMTADPITVGPRDSIHECMQLMTNNRVRHLPVLDKGKMVGIVSIGDVVNWIIGAQSVALDDLERFVMGAHPV